MEAAGVSVNAFAIVLLSVIPAGNNVVLDGQVGITPLFQYLIIFA
jgi:hypothetical protein